MNELWAVWAVLLVIQNAAFTWVSRARNSGSVGYHAFASVASNGVWFASNLVLLANVVDVARRGDWMTAVAIGVFYTVCTTTGAVLMHWASMRYLETGRRRVGA